MNYHQGETPSHAYDQWVANWQPPNLNMRVRRGCVLVEFGPKGSTSTMWESTDRNGFNAKVIFDSTGELNPGDEVGLEGENGQNFTFEGRTLTIVPKKDILVVMTEEAA